MICIYGTCHNCDGKQALSEAVEEERSRAEAALEAQADLQRQLTNFKGQHNLLRTSQVLFLAALGAWVMVRWISHAFCWHHAAWQQGAQRQALALAMACQLPAQAAAKHQASHLKQILVRAGALQ